RHRQSVTADGQAVRFAGDSEVSVAGDDAHFPPKLDLNLMIRGHAERSAGGARMYRLSLEGRAALQCVTGTVIVLSRATGVSVEAAEGADLREVLGSNDALVVHSAYGVALRLSSATQAAVVVCELP